MNYSKLFILKFACYSNWPILAFNFSSKTKYLKKFQTAKIFVKCFFYTFLYFFFFFNFYSLKLFLCCFSKNSNILNFLKSPNRHKSARDQLMFSYYFFNITIFLTFKNPTYIFFFDNLNFFFFFTKIQKSFFFFETNIYKIFNLKFFLKLKSKFFLNF